jgi:hypothetical protein
VSNEPYANIRADKATLALEGDKSGSIRFKGGSMDFAAIVQPNQYLQVSVEGGCWDVRVKFRPKPVKLWEITEQLLDGSLQEKVTRIAELFDVPVSADEKE